MAHEVPWNKIIVERFIELAMLTKDEEKILRTRVAGWSRVEQSMKFNMSIQKVDRIIRSLKDKYDLVQQYDVLLPKRKHSKEEDELDKV